MKWIESLSDGVDRICRFLMAFFISVAFICTVYQVFSRYVLQSSVVTSSVPSINFSNLNFPWMEELIRYAFVWAVFVGVGVVYRLKGHAQVEIVVNFLSEGMKRLFRLCVELLNALFFVVLFIYGLQMMQTTDGQLSPSLQINMADMYLSILACSFVCFVHALRFFFADLLGKKQVLAKEVQESNETAPAGHIG